MAERDSLSTVKDILSILQSLAIGGLIALLLFLPEWTNKRLQRAHVSEISAGGLKWSAEKAGGEAASANIQLKDVHDVLDQIATANNSQVPLPVRNQLKVLADNLATSQQQVQSASDTLKKSLSQDQQASSRSDALQQGWIYLGHIDEQKKRWTYTNARTLDGQDPTLSPGQVLVALDDLYLRAPAAPGQHSSAPTIGVVPSGSHIKVLELDSSSHALQGGWFVWALIQKA